MSNENSTPRTADWAPGTLDNTRKNIGSISAKEAEKMAQKLGGEVMRERYSSSSSFDNKGKSSRGGVIVRETKKAKASDAAQSSAPVKKMTKREQLPTISHNVDVLINKLMMSSTYKIKPNFGVFNFIRKFQKNGTEKIIPEFADVTLKMHMENMELFITNIKMLIQIAPNQYKAKIVGDTDAKYRFLRMVANWTMQAIKYSYVNITNTKEPLIVADLIPFVRAIYKPLMSLYYFDETKIPKLIKEIYTDISAYPDVDQEQLSKYSKVAVTQWLYISTEIIQKLYPLLMRMSTTVYEDFPSFFTTNIADILKFLGLHKYDLLLPEKPKPAAEVEKVVEKQPEVEMRGKHDEVVDTGISLLNQLFPQAGFDNLESHPDLFPYFQPMYNFTEGFNMLAADNPLQVTVVLIRILEDFFRGCRNINFTNTQDADDSGKSKEQDSMQKVLDEWSAYREEVFEKLYCRPLRSLVNETYSKPDFVESHLGKKYLTEILWKTKNLFLPHFKFQQLTLERPSDESKYVPFFNRTHFIRNYLTEAVKECDKMAKSRGKVVMIGNPWEHYHFDIPNEISKRLDVLLGAQNMSETTNANNANVLKYTLCILAVLDWWVNNRTSPAYSSDPMSIYRVSTEDGKPVFSTDLRTDQNRLFADSIRAAYQKK